MVSKIFESIWQELGFNEPTAIQAAVYQPLKTDDSVLGLAPTGSGKTLAFALPLLEKLVPGDGLQLLILAPAQELAMQERTAIQPFAKAAGLTIQAVAGGANIRRQIERLKQKPEVLVATPGRLLELIDQRKVKMHTVQTIVIDEADKLLTDESRERTRDVVRRAPGETQLAFFSATKIPILDELPKWFGVPVTTFDVRAEDNSAGEVQHLFLEAPIRKRVDLLRRLSHIDDFYGLVFFATLAELEKVAKVLQHQHVPLAILDSDLRQTEREKALTGLRKRQIKLLLTTDVSGRGLDIPALPAVINYDLPLDLITYIHRAGRTGRMGQAGSVITLGNERQFRDLKQLVRSRYQVERGYLHEGSLTTTQPEHDVHPRKKPTPTAAKQVATPVKPKKKKQRQRNRLNKGKRRKTNEGDKND
ncbi:DEAD/DEAH box helicase [Loigolactobacillus jiayinensis]|uniref:DEAD/DEAH box helicase n=1 Tax=Loigolactobacillus jiayinensis TaxID=2486016 RepID=A0ABW1RFM6_9LACO|nr:DEAD/DEAH box helicase [Loigolactobacillus jiayinensis]